MYELMDQEGYEKWKAEHPDADVDQQLTALKTFFRIRNDMTKEDFYAGRDPLRVDDVQP